VAVRTADGWRGFLIAVQLDGWPITPPSVREAGFPAGEWMEDPLADSVMT
jgi:hypothetical protein